MNEYISESNINKYDKIVIQFDDEHEPEDTIREVLGLIEDGYTSGYYPNWEMVKNTEDVV